MQVTFGGYCLDLATRQLLRGKTEVRLSPKAFDLLQLLIDIGCEPFQSWNSTIACGRALS